MGRIRVLSDNVANKIAAGEVVERPASVVKELLENSLDAGATRLRIEVEAGGRRRILVADDGSGMGRDDAMLAFERHATSKLRDAQDLLAIQTLGFRGEALPSIASVSRLLLETRSEEEPTGTRVEIAGGKMLSVEEKALPSGATITVNNLFYNMPARRKFLRTEPTELAHIASLVTHYSLAHIDKTFTLSNEKGKLLNVTPVPTLRERVYQIFGSETLEQLVELKPVERELYEAPSPVPPTQAVAAARSEESEPERKIYRLSGFVSTPHVQKLNRNSVYFFVNRRLIRDRLLLKALTSAYYNLIPPGCFPFALLFLDLPCEDVDVNVHPSKTEVRFRQQSFVYEFLRETVRQRLIESKPVSNLPLGPEQRGAAQPATNLPFSESSLLLTQDDAPAAEAFDLRRPAGPAPRLDFGSGAIELAPYPGETRAEAAAQSGVAAGEIAWATEPAAMSAAAGAAGPTVAGLAAGEPSFEPSIEHHPHSRDPLAEPRDSLAKLGELRPLGQIHDSFIIASGADGLWIIDQHVAHERILFEKVLRERSKEKVQTQRLLLPIIVTLTPQQEVVFAQIEQEFRANGFDLEPFGHRTIAIKAAPAGLTAGNIETLIHEILDTPERELRALSLTDLQRRIAATVACHAAIKVNMPLDAAKMQWLLNELARTECPMSCPHGRPVALKYGLREILKAFHRI
jgi:DNA mismatch repair protein MutL